MASTQPNLRSPPAAPWDLPRDQSERSIASFATDATATTTTSRLPFDKNNNNNNGSGDNSGYVSTARSNGLTAAAVAGGWQSPRERMRAHRQSGGSVPSSPSRSQGPSPLIGVVGGAGGGVGLDEVAHSYVLKERNTYTGPQTPNIGVGVGSGGGAHSPSTPSSPPIGHEGGRYPLLGSGQGQTQTRTNGYFDSTPSSAFPSALSSHPPSQPQQKGFSDSPLWSTAHAHGVELSPETEKWIASKQERVYAVGGGAGGVGVGGLRYGKAKDSQFAAIGGAGGSGRRSQKAPVSRKKKWWIIGIVAAIIVILAVVIPVVLVVKNKDKNKNGNAGSSGQNNVGTKTSSAATPTASANPIDTNGNTTTLLTPLNPLSLPLFSNIQQGTDGTTIQSYVNGTLTSFTYTNPYGGNYFYDPSNPLSGGGKANSWTPSIAEPWVWGRDLVRGVNLGGWLVLEPFIVPAIFEANPGAIDEWTLTAALGAKGAGVLEKTMREHYETFITEQDFAEIAGAGLNYVRIPLGFWAVSKLSSEPYLESVSWEYFVRSIGWARKYGLRIILDLHALPGSQNGWNHSGRSGLINWMFGVMGISNAQRTLEVLRTLTEFVSQDQYKDVVTIISLVNEVLAATVGLNPMASFYLQAYHRIRGITGFGSGKGPIILGHEGFMGISQWQTLLPGADRFGLDQHPYLAFMTPQNTRTMLENQQVVCGWGGGTNDSQTNFGLTIAGEWSVAVNDCGFWLTGVGSTPGYQQEHGNCSVYDNWQTWTEEWKTDIRTLALAEMDALQNWVFWTWRIGNSTTLGYPSCPYWHMRLGLSQGWLPKDFRQSTGTCTRIGIGGNQFAGTFPSSATGGGSGDLTSSLMAAYTAWPAAIGYEAGAIFTDAQIPLLPTYTQTGKAVTLTHVSMPTAAPTQAGNGWAQPTDTALAYAPVSGCAYPDPYSATALALLPSAVCTGA